MDLEAIKRKLNQLQSQTKRQDFLWKPEPGKQQIRIVPYQHNKDNPFQELYFHYDLGKKNYLSPITHGNADPVVEFAEKLKASGNSDEWKLGKKLEPKMRCYVPIVVRGKESEGVKFWGFGKTVYTELLGFIADPDYGDLTDPSNGRDIVVEFIPSEGAGSYPKTTIRVKPNTTPLTADRAIAEKVAQQQANLSEVFKEPTYDELKEALEAWLNPSEETESDNANASVADAGSAAGSALKPNTSFTGGVNSVNDIEDAFDELFS
jgi:hypothetical protein